jgi:wyosine [tRNA(Phe)-imidazoG37] synthetase (radical SAM superfamily)
MSLRFGRVLVVELTPPPDPPCRYCRVLAPDARPASRTHFSVPAATARAVLARIERGVSVDAVVLGGDGEPLRQVGVGAICRKIRRDAHLPTIVLTDGTLLGDREVRRELADADTVVAWLPALRDRAAEPARGPAAAGARADAWEHHVEGIASLRRETQVKIALEIPVLPGRNDGDESRAAWRRAAERIRPDRVFVIPDPRAGEDAAATVAATLEQVRLAIHPAAGAYLPDGTIVDRRCGCGEGPEA